MSNRPWDRLRQAAKRRLNPENAGIHTNRPPFVVGRGRFHYWLAEDEVTTSRLFGSTPPRTFYCPLP